MGSVRLTSDMSEFHLALRENKKLVMGMGGVLAVVLLLLYLVDGFGVMAGAAVGGLLLGSLVWRYGS